MNNNKNILIIGAGQLGSRHYQGVLKCEDDLNIFIVDPNTESLEVSQKRGDEIAHEHTVQFLTDLAGIPEFIDVCIIATNSNVRAKVVTQLLKVTQVKSLILEKVLFQSLPEYAHIADLLTHYKVDCWVNHPLRQFPFYQDIKKELANEDLSKAVFQLYGQNWGMGCNGLHWIDLFGYLSNQTLSGIDHSFLDPQVIESKREGYVEFTGTLNGRFSGNALFSITGISESSTGVKQETLVINTPGKRLFIKKGAQLEMMLLDKDDSFNFNTRSGKSLYQSELTTMLVKDLLDLGNCDLPTYATARKTHEPFLTSLMKVFKKVTPDNKELCPIT